MITKEQLHSAFREGFSYRGEMAIEVRDRYGKLKKLWKENRFGKFIRRYLGLDLQGIFFLGHWTNNLVIANTTTNVGFAVVAGLFGNVDSQTAFTYLEVGTGTNAAAAGDTALQTAITDSGLARAAATVSRVTTTQTNDTCQLLKSWSVSGTKAITEAGAFNASSAGVMAGRQVFSAVNVVSGDTFQLTYKFKFS